MIQIIQLDKGVRQQVIQKEQECETLAAKLLEQYKQTFFSLNEVFVIELIRNIKGKQASSEEIFKENYESYIEIGVEKDEEYFPNTYIPIWKCRQEMFQNIGYLTSKDIRTIEDKLHEIIKEMQEDSIGEGE